MNMESIRLCNLIHTLRRGTRCSEQLSWGYHNDFGAILKHAGKLEESAMQFRVAIQKSARDRNFRPKSNLAVVLQEAGDFRAAEKLCKSAL